eukprot:gene52816-36428_t
MVTNMRELRNYMPQHMVQGAQHDDEEEEAQAKEVGEMGSVSHRSSRASRSRQSDKRSMGMSSLGSSRSAVAKAFLKKVAGEGLKKKMVSLLVANVVGFHETLDRIGNNAMTDHHAGVIGVFLLSANIHKGIVDSFSGDM